MVDMNNLDPQQISQLISMLQKMLPTEEPTKIKKAKTTRKKSVGPIKSKKIDTEEARENKFLDMPERQMHKSDCLIDQKLNKFPPTPRARLFECVEVKCRVCGKTEEVSPKLLPESLDRYKCNRCSSTEG